MRKLSHYMEFVFGVVVLLIAVGFLAMVLSMVFK